MMRLPWKDRTVPHAALDILRGCNCRCANCYNAGNAKAKTLAQLKSELAVIRGSRNVTTVTLSGGEPLLHPDLDRIIAWLHDEEHLTVCSLTNGILFDDAAAERMSRAGCSLVTLHIQEGQVRPDADDSGIDDLRRAKGRIARAHGLFPALILTLDATDGPAFSRLASFFRSASEYEYVLVTLARDFSRIDPRIAQSDVETSPMLAHFAATGFRPAAFVGGRWHRDVPRWYVLQSVQALGSDGKERDWNETRPGLIERIFLCGYALFFRRSIHWVSMSSAKLKVRLILNGLTGGRLSTLGFALRATFAGWRVVEKHIVVQLPPYSLGDGRIETCDSCPDATVKDGRLRPLCLADVNVEVEI